MICNCKSQIPRAYSWCLIEEGTLAIWGERYVDLIRQSDGFISAKLVTQEQNTFEEKKATKKAN